MPGICVVFGLVSGPLGISISRSVVDFCYGESISVYSRPSQIWSAIAFGVFALVPVSAMILSGAFAYCCDKRERSVISLWCGLAGFIAAFFRILLIVLLSFIPFGIALPG